MDGLIELADYLENVENPIESIRELVKAVDDCKRCYEEFDKEWKWDMEALIKALEPFKGLIDK